MQRGTRPETAAARRALSRVLQPHGDRTRSLMQPAAARTKNPGDCRAAAGVWVWMKLKPVASSSMQHRGFDAYADGAAGGGTSGAAGFFLAAGFFAAGLLTGAAFFAASVFAGAAFFTAAFLAGAAFLAATFFTAPCLAGAFLAAGFFTAAFLAGAAFLAEVFFAATFFTAAFLAATFLAGAFFTAAFFTGAAFLAAGFFTAAFLAGAAAFFAAVFFSGAAAFFAAAFFAGAAAFLAAAFLAGAAAFFAAGFLIAIVRFLVRVDRNTSNTLHELAAASLRHPSLPGHRVRFHARVRFHGHPAERVRRTVDRHTHRFAIAPRAPPSATRLAPVSGRGSGLDLSKASFRMSVFFEENKAAPRVRICRRLSAGCRFDGSLCSTPCVLFLTRCAKANQRFSQCQQIARKRALKMHRACRQSPRSSALWSTLSRTITLCFISEQTAADRANAGSSGAKPYLSLLHALCPHVVKKSARALCKHSP